MLTAVCLETELKSYAAENQGNHHQNNWHIQRREYGRVSEWESCKQSCTAQYHPGFIAIPDRSHGIHHDITFILMRKERKQDADAQIETIKNSINQYTQTNNHNPD